ncbi:MAG: phytanoyl-CoA dioxygenase family protein [Gammaproteobacteria bacterium]|nr:phytanoyl-CoA dioxygenase family protein [Gammaproteobacteria bacterium]
MNNKNANQLTAEEITRFHDVGWIARKNLFRHDEVNRMRDCFDDLERMAGGMTASGLLNGSQFVLGMKGDEQVIKRVVWAGGSQSYLLDVSMDARLTMPGSQLLQSTAMEQLLCQAHFKRPGDGVIFGWHQDIQHRDKGAGTWTDVNGIGSYVQTLIVIDEMTADSGPLLFVPGSSKWGRVDFGHHDYDDPDYAKRKPPQFNETDAVTVLAEPGDTLFFGPYTAHASFENTSDAYRRVLINGYAYPGANHRVYPGDGAGRTLSVGPGKRLDV